MSGFSHPMVRRSDRNPRAEAVGDNNPSSGLDTPLQSVASHPLAMESTPESSATTTESPELSDESSESVTDSQHLHNHNLLAVPPVQDWDWTWSRPPSRHPRHQRWNRRTSLLTQF